MKSSPLVSVLMIAYNHERYLVHAVESVVSQQCEFPFELIIGDDCSSDATWDIAQAIQSRHPDVVRLLHHQPNVGMNENLRLVVAEARGEYLAFCEGDDFWSDTAKLAKQVDAIRQDSGASLIYSDFGRCFEWQGSWYGVPRTIAEADREKKEATLVELLKQMPIHLSAALCRTDLVRDYFASSHYKSNRSLGDVPLFLYLATRGRVIYLDGSFSMYRQHPASATNRSKLARLRIVQDHVDVVREFCEKYVASTEDKRKVHRASRARLAAAGYSAGSLPVFLRNMNWCSFKEIIRALLMMVPFFHRHRLEVESKRQLSGILADAKFLV